MTDNSFLFVMCCDALLPPSKFTGQESPDTAGRGDSNENPAGRGSLRRGLSRNRRSRHSRRLCDGAYCLGSATGSFNYLVRANQKILRDAKPQCIGRFRIEY